MKKIYIVLLVTLLTRIYHINFPVLGWHSWRQSDTASIAKNFYDNGFRILHPQINWAGNSSGYVESEFQIYPFLVSVLYKFFGADDMWGRLLSVLFSLFAVYGLYLLVRKIIDEKTALWSCIIYAILPLNIFYGRAFMPESAMLMCSIFSVYFFSEWIDKQSIRYFLLSVIFTSMAALLKLPELYLGLPLSYLLFKKFGWKGFVKPQSLLFAILVFLPVIFWYYHAHQLLLNGGVSFGIWSFGKDKWGMFELLLLPNTYSDIFFKSIAERHLTYPAFILLLPGLFIKRKYSYERVFDFWLIGVIVFILIAAQANLAQEYYQLPFTIVASVFIGKTFAKYLHLDNIRSAFRSYGFKSYFIALCLILICILSYLRVARFMNGESWDSPVLKIGNDVQAITQKNDLVLTVSNGNPVYLYHCDRKGWTMGVHQFNKDFLEEKRKEGAKWVVGEKGFFETDESKEEFNKIISRYTLVKNEKDYFIIKLN